MPGEVVAGPRRALRARLRARKALLAVLALTLAAPAPAAAQTTTVIRASLHPDRPHALAQLRLSIGYEDPQSPVPPPVRHAVLRLPAGLQVEVPQLRSCSAARLRSRGPRACPAPSHLGGGQALAEAHVGSQTLAERVTLSTFLGPLVGLTPTFEIFAQGFTPFERRVVVGGTVVPDDPPYGESLSISVPPIATLPLEPDASIVSLSLSVGSRTGPRAPRTAVLVPSHCPHGGLPFAIRSTFADGSTSSASTSVACP